VIERAVILSQGSTLRLAETLSEPAPPMSASATPISPAASAPPMSAAAASVTLEELEREHVLEVLDQCNWRISGKKGAATILGLHPNTLRFRMKKLGIKKPSS
jgi:transcriptional regulator with GAF, ATPase, and Fis domain